MIKLGLSCLLLPLLALCSARDPQRAHTLSATSKPIPKCGAGVNADYVARVMLKASFDPAASGGTVVHYQSIVHDTNDDDDDTAYKNSPSNKIDGDDSLFDIGLQSMGSSSGQWVEIKVIIGDPRYSFYHDASFNGVGIGDVGDNSQLCYKGDGVVRSKPNANGRQVAVFFAQTQAPTIAPGAYNIGLQVAGQNTVLFVDPKIMNSG